MSENECYNEGCIDLYFNYDSLATNEDVLVMKLLKNCSFEWADNYNDYDGDEFLNEITGGTKEDVNTDDGSCFRLGCTSEWADNYDELATTDNGSCDRLGCMSDWVDNYDSLATQNTLRVM